MPKNILHTIEKNMSSFSKGQKLIARFILEDYDKAAFMTASKLGKTVQVSESTVVRFATQLGYDGYPSMQRALQEMIRGKLTSIQRIQASDGELAGSDLMTNVLQRDMEKIRMAIDQTEGAEFERVVDTIIGVTDSVMSPVYQMSSGSLLVRNEMISFVDSLAAPMSMLNALILAAAHKQGTDISATFNELEHVWDRFGIFGKVEDE